MFAQSYQWLQPNPWKFPACIFYGVESLIFKLSSVFLENLKWVFFFLIALIGSINHNITCPHTATGILIEICTVSLFDIPSAFETRVTKE